MATGPLFWALKARVRTVVKPRAGRNPNPEPRPNALDKLVLITIADQASEADGWSALLPLWFLADRAECTERAARESVRRLEAAGLVRCRDVVLEGSEASAWRRYYLLAPESPVTQGVLEISWDEPEQIRRAVFERHRAVVLSRHEDGGERPAKKRSCPQPPEPGSGGEPDPRNQVPPQGRNQVPPPPEPGSAPGAEPGSALISLSSRNLLLPPPDARASASESSPSSPQEGGGGGGGDLPAGGGVPEGASSEAWEFVRGLPWERVPTRAQQARLAALVARAFAAGWTSSTLRRYLTAELAGARSLYAVWTSRLEQLPEAPPAAPAGSRPGAPAGPVTVIAECPGCERGFRVALGEDGQPVTTHCRDCREAMTSPDLAPVSA